MSASSARVSTFLVAALVAAAGVSGCFGKKTDDQDAAENADPAQLALSFVGFGAPDGASDVVVETTIDHVALLGSDGEWRPIFAEAATTEVVLEDGFGEPAFLATVPVPPGTYTAIEVIATAATVTDSSGTSSAIVASVACYSDIEITTEEATLAELQLLLSGPDALQSDGTSWTFRPAVVGSLAPEDPSGEAAIDDPDCRAI